MKRWILLATFSLFLLATGIISMNGWFSTDLFDATPVISPGFIERQGVNWKERKEENMTEQGKMINSTTDIIKIELGGHRYNVPIWYTYGQTVEKQGRWLRAKPERVKVRALTISVLLPDLRPYHKEDDAYWKERGHGKRLEATITNSLGEPDWFKRLKNYYFGSTKKPGTEISNNDVYGLIQFEDKGLGIRYFPLNIDLQLTITCDSEKNNTPAETPFSTSCKVKTNYKDGIAIEYYYGKRNLELWREIDIKLKRLFDDFERAAQ